MAIRFEPAGGLKKSKGNKHPETVARSSTLDEIKKAIDDSVKRKEEAESKPRRGRPANLPDDKLEILAVRLPPRLIEEIKRSKKWQEQVRKILAQAFSVSTGK